jgi:hypothetical protein
MKYCTVQSMEVYGSPNEAVRTSILSSVGEHKVTFTPELVGYYHFG